MSAETPRDAVVRILIALERSCLDADSAVVERRWPELDAALATQRALTDELAAVFAAAPEMAPDRDPQVAQRIRGILAYRDDQLRRLQAYHAEVETRLRSIGRVRALSRTIGKDATARLLDMQY